MEGCAGVAGLFLSFSFSFSFSAAAFLDLEDLDFEREPALSPAGSMGKGAFGSTFLITRNDAITVYPPGNHSKIACSGKR